MISDAQSAFVPDRLITDNTTVAYELLHRLQNRRKGKKGQMTVKLDISEAYDRVEWIFLQQMMVKLGFIPTWVKLAMETVTIASYLVLINGEPKGFITPTRGIQQGNPLSPYLFLMCVEGLSTLVRKAGETRVLKGIKSSQNGVWVSHILFADDSLLFCQATMEENQKLLQLLAQYEVASSQATNRQNISLFFSKNTKPEVKEQIKQIFWGRVMTECERYLGLSMATGKSKVNTFKDLQEKITKRVMGWKEKTISKVGREVLIKMVAQVIPTYSMSLFKLPNSICDNINSMMAKYWWGQNQEERRTHWINWTKLCIAKKEGELGFGDLHAFNLAMLVKQAWRLIDDNHSLFYRVYKARYFPNSSFMMAELGNNPSYVWRSLLSAREVIKEGTRWKVGDGGSIGVFTHSWLSHILVTRIEVPLDMKVCELIGQDLRQWDKGKVFATFTAQTKDEILSLPLNNTNGHDSVIWMENRAKEFTVKSAYKVAYRLRHQHKAEHSAARMNGSTWNMV